MKPKHAFTLIELLVVIAIIAIISAFLFPALSSSRGNARRMECLGNLRQVNLAIRLYADDFSDSLPVLPDPSPYPNGTGLVPSFPHPVPRGTRGVQMSERRPSKIWGLR